VTEEARRRQAEVDRVVFWWHSVDVGHGVVTPGHKTPEILADEWAALALGDLTGRSVLDIGAWDGGFSFLCEDAGAARVVALDDVVWGIELAGMDGPDYVRPANPAVPSDPALPGRVGFETAHRLRGSRVEPIVGSFANDDLTGLGQFDVVLFLGVLYHLENPFAALRKVFDLVAPGGSCVIETQAILAQEPDRLLWEFYPGTELGGDPSNWWSPTPPALLGACAAAGFAPVYVLRGAPPDLAPSPGYHRAIVRAHVPAAS
jgi:tRNA (mo5U34)-methyltransferase